jgi:molybdopterin/thiamine biosynthesis adenylyltransferase
MNDSQLLRYSRHILLNEIAIHAPKLFKNPNLFKRGGGGGGSPAALYLAASGVGRLTLCDDDTVDLSNLQRQITHRTSTLSQPKVRSAQTVLHDINPEVECIALSVRAEGDQLHELVGKADVVLDCSDNFATRYAINHACLLQRKPLVSGAAIQFDGQVEVFDFRLANQPCYNCLFPQDSQAAELRCATTGVFAPLTGVIGTLQAAEALKLLIGIDHGLSGKLLTFNALNTTITRSILTPDPACPVCSGF